MCKTGHWVNVIGYIVLHYNAGRCGENLTHFLHRKIIFKFNIYRFAVATHYRHTYSCGCNFYIIIIQNFLCFIYHFHLLFGVAVFQKHIYLWYQVKVYRVLICHGAIHTISFIHKLIHSRFAGAGYTLVCAYHHSLNTIFFMQWFQHQHHLDSRAIWVSNDLIVSSQCISIYFGHY